MHVTWKLKRTIVVAMLLASMLFVFHETVSAGPSNENWWVYPELQPREIFSAPHFNWSKFWMVFKNHSLWSMEGWNPNTEEWEFCNDSLTINRIFTAENSVKLSLIFDAPAPITTDYRFTLAIDYRVKKWVHYVGNHTYNLSFEVHNESFNVSYNFSDIVNIPGIIITHGVKNIGGHDYFWFRARRNNVPSGYHIELDPTYTVFSVSGILLQYSHQRKLVRQSNGTLWCTFHENDDVHVAWSEDDGATWNDLEVYGDATSRHPTIAVDSKDVVHLVFRSFKSDADDWQLEYSNSTSWSTIVQIRNEDKYHQFPSLAIDSNDNLHVVYEKGEEGTSKDDQVGYINSTDNGGSWGTEKILTDEADDGDDAWYPSIAIDSNDVLHVVFECEDHYNVKDDILHMQSSDYGDSWTDWDADPVYQDSSYNQHRPCIAIDDNDVLHVVWTGVCQNTNDQIGYSYDDGGGWSTVEWLTWDPSEYYLRSSVSVNDNDYIHCAIEIDGRRLNHSVNDTTSWSSMDMALDGDYGYPNMICAQHPIIGGAKTNRPKTGYAFITGYGNTNVTYYASGDLTWDTNPTDGDPGGDVTISNISPVNESIAAEIVGNPPEYSGYVNLSFTLTDADADNDAEFYLNISIDGGETYVNRLHQLAVGDGEYHQHEKEHNTTYTTYYWSVAYRDGSEPFKTEIFHYRTEAKPQSDTPTPANGSSHLYGNVTLSCVVHHPDGGLAPPINVTFYEWPSGRIIGYDNSSYNDGDTATCDTPYYCPDNGTKYYWYATARDDEFTNTSATWFFKTWYNDSEPATVWYTTGGDIWVEPAYTESEPSTIWYTLGGNITTYQNITFNNPVPADDATDQNLSLILSIDVNSSTPKEKTWITRPTANGTTIECNMSGDTNNWKCVDDTTPDGNTTLVYTDDNESYDLDLYELSNHTVEQHGDQLNVTVYFNCTNNTSPDCGNDEPGTAKASVCTGGATHYEDVETLTDSWVEYSYTWDLNPETSAEWTWDEIDDLEAGVSMVGGNCTQVYVSVHYRQDVSLLTTQFYTNDTVDGRWAQIGSDIAEQRTNYTATTYFSGLQFDKDCWWRARMYNTTLGIGENSSDYHFTTKSPAPEPAILWYTLGGDIWVEPPYVGVEPDKVWYTLGGMIDAYFTILLNGPSPANGSTDQWVNQILSFWANKSSDAVEYAFTFYTNDTHDGSWVSIGTSTYDIPTNRTVSTPFCGLEYGKKYWWKVIAVAFGDTQSAIWHFTTANYTDTEPPKVWYTVGGDIWVEPLYTETEPSTVWYTLGGKMQAGYSPDQPSDPYPADNSGFGTHILGDFSCLVTDRDGDTLDVTFYDASDDSVFGTDNGVANNTYASVSVPTEDMTNYSWFEWYVVVDDGTYQTTGPTWRYRPGNRAPLVSLSPDEGDIHVPVRREIVAGVYQYFVRLNWTIEDVEGDIMEFYCYVDNPAIGNWDDWLSRWHIADAVNGTYWQDEELFDTLLTTYHWRLYLADQYNETDYYVNFTTEFYFFANFTWEPYRASTEDDVLFIDQSANATEYWWYVNGVLVANASGVSASDQFNMTHKFNISNVYNITQVVYNEICLNQDSMTKYIYIDRNLSLNRSAVSAITYYGQSPNSSISASELCSLIGILSNAWVHMYNNTRNQWDSFWIDFPGLTTDFDISLWDALAVVIGRNYSKRMNITEDPDQREAHWSETAALENQSNASQTLELSEGLNYICWSNVSSTKSFNLTDIGLGITDWVYEYNTSTGIWNSTYYWPDPPYPFVGTNFTISAYDVLVLQLAMARTITIEDGFP